LPYVDENGAHRSLSSGGDIAFQVGGQAKDERCVIRIRWFEEYLNLKVKKYKTKR
jgi:hypothetical protein